MRDYPYELVGGHPSLDFLNTIHDWTAEERLDRLGEFHDVVAFAVAAGVLRPAEARRLENYSGGSGALRRLRELRERLARVFQAVISSSVPDAADLDRLAKDAARAAAAARLHSSRGAIARTIELDDAGADVVRWRLIDTAVDLLMSDKLGDVKSCPSCGWFFLDTSKNGSRRWCSMKACGSVVKARRYYHRVRR
jgi:predicted RNA-binding Zn ribbon-like protein